MNSNDNHHIISALIPAALFRCILSVCCCRCRCCLPVKSGCRNSAITVVLHLLTESLIGTTPGRRKKPDSDHRTSFSDTTLFCLQNYKTSLLHLNSMLTALYITSLQALKITRLHKKNLLTEYPKKRITTTLPPPLFSQYLPQKEIKYLTENKQFKNFTAIQKSWPPAC